MLVWEMVMHRDCEKRLQEEMMVMKRDRKESFPGKMENQAR